MTTTTNSLDRFNELVDAEEYFEFFDMPYDPQVLNVNRLHILRKFSQLVRSADRVFSEGEQLGIYRNALQMAYDLFLTSSGVEQKLFKVFRDKPQNVVMVSDIGVE
ncbi:MAG: nitrogenase-stabilizing/protective protein NifW [Cyanobacteria bacterium P01_E01_bin.34]